MFCSQCGNKLQDGAAFCSACGTRVSNGSFSRTYASTRSGFSFSRLMRPRAPRMIAGVCAAIAQEFGWDLTLVRVIWAFLTLFYGLGVLAYVICWIAIPEAPYALPQGR